MVQIVIRINGPKDIIKEVYSYEKNEKDNSPDIGGSALHFLPVGHSDKDAFGK